MAQQLKSYFLTAVPAKDRFLAGDIPTEQTFRHLFDSLRFGSEPTDSASSTKSGLVKRPTNSQLFARASADSNGFSLSPGPHQLPTVEAASNKVTVTEDVTGNYVKYKVDVVPGNLGLTPPAAGAWVPIDVFTVANAKGKMQQHYLSNGSFPVKVRTLPNDNIQVVGVASKNGTATAYDIFTLPAGYEPSFNINVPVNYNVSGNNVVAGFLYITTNGNVRLFPEGGSGGVVPNLSFIFMNFIIPIV